MKDMKFELTKDEAKAVLRIAETYFTEYDHIRIGINNVISLYKNYKGHQSFADYGLNYDELVDIHWFEFMTYTIVKKGLVKSIEYLNDINENDTHPLEAYDKFKI